MKSFLSKYYFQNDKKVSHNPSLDGLRGLAVMLVMLAHLSNNKIFLSEYVNFSGIGKSGVYLFFLLSSYLLDRQITLAIRSGNSTIFYWLNYFLRRFLRIYPLYIFLLVVYYFIHQKGYDYCICMKKPHVILSHLTLSKGNGLFWSIPVEFKYYFISPLIILVYAKILRWNKFLITILTMTVIGGISYFTYTNGYFKKTEIYTWLYLPVFLLGSLIAVYQVLWQKKLTALDNSKAYVIDVLGLISLVLVFTLCSAYYFKLVVPEDFKFLYPLLRRLILLQGILFMFVLIACIYGKGIVKRIFSFKPLRFLGVISFSLYLIHFPVLKYVRDLGFDMYESQLKFLLFFVLSVALSMMTYHFIEYPFSKISVFEKEKLFSKSDKD